MPPLIAFCAWIILVTVLLVRDPARDSKTSIALWIPIVWMLIIGSRLPSQWLNVQSGSMVDAMQEGNLTDASIYVALMLLALGVLMARSFRWDRFCADNLPLIALLGFALLSACWSDTPLITLKRWCRDLGTYLVILVVLTDANPVAAFKTTLRRFVYLLIPLSVVILKYFPMWGIQYNSWSGAPEYMGVTTSKNMLGVLCLVSGIFLFWDTTTRWSARKQPRTRYVLAVNFALLLMTAWLLHMCGSSTSQLCMVLGWLIILVVRSKVARRRPTVLKVLIPSVVCLYLVLAFGFGLDINAVVAEFMGKDPTLTGRTVIWNAVMSIKTNPVVGVGYESFWLEPRLLQVWKLTGPGINEAHNGYLEVYLNLGIVGLCLLFNFLIGSYRTICRRLTGDLAVGSLGMAFWALLPFYNVTESAFRGQLVFVTFLFVALVVPEKAKVRRAYKQTGSIDERREAEQREAVLYGSI